MLLININVLFYIKSIWLTNISYKWKRWNNKKIKCKIK